MLRLGETKVIKETFYVAKEPMISDANVDNIIISKLVEAKTNSKYLIGYLYKRIRPLVLLMPKMSEYVKTFKVEDKNSKLMSFHRDDEKNISKI